MEATPSTWLRSRGFVGGGLKFNQVTVRFYPSPSQRLFPASCKMRQRNRFPFWILSDFIQPLHFFYGFISWDWFRLVPLWGREAWSYFVLGLLELINVFCLFVAKNWNYLKILVGGKSTRYDSTLCSLWLILIKNDIIEWYDANSVRSASPFPTV